MASKTVKFEVELRGLKVKFEGDVQIAERFSGEIANAVNNLASAQTKLLPAPVRPAAVVPQLDAGARRGGRRRRRASVRGNGSGGIDPSVIDGTTVTADANGDKPAETTRRRRSGAGPSTLLTTLKDENLFAQRCTIGEICAALAQKGHTYKSNQVSPTLVSLTKKQVLCREKNADGQWMYFA